MKVIRISLFSLCFFFLLVTKSPAQYIGKLHLIAFADLKDKSLMRICEKDLRDIRQWAAAIGEFTGMQVIDLNPDNTFSRKSVDSLVSMVRVSTQDVIIFYYSGHGYRRPLENDKRHFPNFQFRHNEVFKNILNLETVHNLLKIKGARLTITIGDMCNNVVDIFENVGHKGLQYGHVYKQLFLNAKGDIILAAATQGQTAFPTKDQQSSMLTYHLLSQFNKAAQSRDNTSWSILLDKVKQVVTESSMKRQTPFYLYNIQTL